MKTDLVRAFLATLLLAFSLGAGAQGFLKFDQLERDLKLKPEQKVQFDAAVGATKRAVLSVGIVFTQQKQKIADELAKPMPDLEVLAQSQNALIELARPNFREAREEWARLYSLLEPDQVSVAKEYVDKQIAMLETVGVAVMQVLRERMGKLQP